MMGRRERMSKRQISGKTVEREMAERHYKKERRKKKGYDQARALAPALLLNKLSSAFLFLLHM